jgi:hypothetical protein
MTQEPASILEALLTSREAFGLVDATPLQRAICRCSDGVPIGDLWEDAGVREGFGGVLPGAVAPRTLVILAAIRGAKSMIAAAKAFETALTCDVTGLQPGDELRIPVLSVDKDSAHQVFNHLVGTIQSKPHLRQHLVSEPTADSVLLRHQSGRTVEVKVTAMSKYGTTLVGRWLATCIFDEAPRMAGQEDGVRNLDDALHAIAGRMRPGSQIMVIGSPNVPFGPVFEMNQEFFGRPSERIVVVRGTGPLLNPTWWTPERCKWTEVNAPRSYVTDVLGKFADSEDQLFSSVVVDAAMRKGPEVIAARPGHSYVAAIDPAMRGNAWTLVVVGCDGYTPEGEPSYYIALSKQWRGSKSQPLRPDTVLRDIAATVKPYGLEQIWSDGFHLDSLAVIAEQEGITIAEACTTQNDNVERVENIRVLLESKRLELTPDRVLRADLLRVRRKVNQKNTTMAMPVTADGRHCDFVPALGLCLAFPPTGPAVTARQRDPGLEAACRAVDARKERGNAVRNFLRSGTDG